MEDSYYIESAISTIEDIISPDGAIISTDASKGLNLIFEKAEQITNEERDAKVREMLSGDIRQLPVTLQAAAEIQGAVRMIYSYQNKNQREYWEEKLAVLDLKLCEDCEYDYSTGKRETGEEEECEECARCAEESPSLKEILDALELTPSFHMYRTTVDGRGGYVCQSCSFQVSGTRVEINWLISNLGSEAICRVFINGEQVDDKYDCNTTYGRLIGFYLNIDNFVKHFDAQDVPFEMIEADECEAQSTRDDSFIREIPEDQAMPISPSGMEEPEMMTNSRKRVLTV